MSCYEKQFYFYNYKVIACICIGYVCWESPCDVVANVPNYEIVASRVRISVTLLLSLSN